MVTTQFLGNLASDPDLGDLNDGDTWYNTTEDQQKFYDGTEIRIMG